MIEIYAIKTNGILEIISFNVLGKMEDMKQAVIERLESMEDIKKDIKEDVKEVVKQGLHSVKEEVKDMKKDVNERVNEFVEIIKETTKNMDKLKMKERGDFTYPRVPVTGELYLVDFIFALNMKPP